MGTNTGIDYELFVQRVYSALLQIKDIPHHRNIKIQHNVKMNDAGGIERQFDLYWEREEFGTVKRAVIECKDYQNGVSIDRVDALIGKMVDFQNITPVLVTSVKYQSGAIEKARRHGIELLVIRDEDMVKDWQDSDGTPLIRSIIGRIICINSLRIIRFSATIDKSLGISARKFEFRNDLLYVGDNSTGWRVNILQLQKEIEATVKEYNVQPSTYEKPLVDGYEEYEGKRIPIKGFSVQYIYPPPHIMTQKIEPEVLAVFEYVLQGQKEILMKLCGKTIVKEL